MQQPSSDCQNANWASASTTRIDSRHNRLLRRRDFGHLIQWDAGAPADLVLAMWQDPRALLSGGEILQDKPRCTVARIDDGAASFVLKRHNWGSLRRTVKRSLSRSMAGQAWIDSRLLYEAGVPTPASRAYAEERLGPFRSCSYILTDYVPGTSLYRLMRYERPAEELIQHLARQVAAIWQQLDDLGVGHRDFKPENLLVDPQHKVWLIDLDRMRRYRRRARLRRQQTQDLKDLLHARGWRANPGAAEVFRRAILKTPAAQEALAEVAGGPHPLTGPLPAANRAEQLVTVLIPCRNAAGTIRECLRSVRDMADEILVADAGATDDTLRLVEEFGGCRIVRREDMQRDNEGDMQRETLRDLDPAAFEAWAASQARHPWILRVSPDERLSPDLGREVQDLLATEPADDGFRISRDAHFRGHRLKHGGFGGEPTIRLYRKEAARRELRDGRLEVTFATERVRQLRARLVYEIHPSLSRHLSELVALDAQAAENARQTSIRRMPRAALWRAPWQFLRTYILRHGWLDGRAGLHASCLTAFAVYLRETLPQTLPRDSEPAACLLPSQPEHEQPAAARSDDPLRGLKKAG